MSAPRALVPFAIGVAFVIMALLGSVLAVQSSNTNTDQRLRAVEMRLANVEEGQDQLSDDMTAVQRDQAQVNGELVRRTDELKRASRSSAPRPRIVRSSGSCEQWRPLVERYFPASQVPKALAVMRCESGCRPEAVNGIYRGLFQIGHGTYDAEGNVRHAAEMFARRGWQPWTCA